MGEAPLLNDKRLSLVREAIIAWFDHHGRDFAWRKTSDPYQILIAEILLRRTTATAVSRIYLEFLKRFISIERLAKARTKTIERALNTVGLQSVRARNMQKMAKMVLKDYGGLIPKDQLILESLPGVGRYAAAAMMNFAFDEPEPMVDGNVVHLINRVFSLGVSDPKDNVIWEFMKHFGGPQDKRLYWGIIDIVASVCLRRVPRCHECPLSESCDYYAANPK
jgi:A/G-specific adenine glycosylase